MTYLSSTDRRAETESAEERRVEIMFEFNAGKPTVCPWCGKSARKHGPEALARCEAAFTADVNRRMAGPLRVQDMARRRP